MNILLISDGALSSKHAGGLRLIRIYSAIKLLNPSVKLYQLSILRENIEPESWPFFAEQFEIQADELRSQRGFQNFLDTCDIEFDAIELSSIHVFGLLKHIRRNKTYSKIILTIMESQVRACWILLLKFRIKDFKFWKELVSRTIWSLYELYYIYRADLAITVSIADYEVLRLFPLAKQKLKNLNTFEPNHSIIKNADTAGAHINASKKVIIFFAYFGSQTNIESVRWFAENVHQELCKLHPEYRLHICGSGISTDLREYLSRFKQIVVVGEVDDIGDALITYAIGIAPALSGSGVRGKIHQYSSYYMATVATSIATAGLHYTHSESIFKADDAKKYFEYCNLLLENSAHRVKIASKAHDTYQRHYTQKAVDYHLKDIYGV